MQRFMIGFVLVVIMAAASATLAQETPLLVLTLEDAGQTLAVATGSVIEVRLPLSDLAMNYDPQRLQFLGSSGADFSFSSSSSSGVVTPEVSPPLGSPPSGESGAGEVESGVGVAQPGVEGVEESLAWWQFRAIAPGDTTLEFQTYMPPCLEGQTCPLMPELSVVFFFHITGDPIRPVPGDGATLVVTAACAEQTITVQSGQIVALALDGRPLAVQYNPALVEYLPGDILPRFRVLATGVTTYVWAASAAGGFGVYLNVPAACDSCGVIDRLVVEKVEGLLLMSYPPRLSLTITFNGPSSCSNPIRFEEVHNGNAISILMYRDGGGACTADFGLQTVNYVLESRLESGAYTVDVNGYTFTVQV